MRMAEAARAVSSSAAWVGGDVENDVIGMCRVPAYSSDTRQVIQAQIRAGPPRDVMVAAGGISADADGSNYFLASSVKSQSAAENVHASDFASNHGIVSGAVLI